MLGVAESQAEWVEVDEGCAQSSSNIASSSSESPEQPVPVNGW